MFILLDLIPFGLKITLALLGIFSYVVYRYLTRHFEHWANQGVKFDKPVPLFGSISTQFLLKEHILQYVQRLYQKNEGEPFIGFFQGRTPTLLVLDPEFAKQIFVRDFSHFVDHGFKIHEDADPLQAKNLFNLRGQKWKDMRTKLLPTFTSGKIKSMFPLMQQCAEQFDEHLGRMADKSEVFEAKDLMGCLFTDIIGSCIFGISTNTIKDPNNQFRVMGKRLIELSGFQAIKMMLIVFFPEVATKLKIGIFGEEVTNFFRKLVKDVMEMRKKSNTSRKDFIQLLIELKEKGSITIEEADVHEIENDLKTVNSMKFSDDDLTAQATVFFLAGFETSSTLLSFTLLELAANPDIQRKAQMELDDAFSQNNNALNYETLKDMKYLDAILQESLRKYPPLAIQSRECTKTYVIPDSNVTIEKGILVTIPSHAMQNDPKYFPNPDNFDPERFSDEESLRRYQYIHTPFGEGPRQCIGNRFAIVQSKLALLTILRKYSVSFCDKTVYPVKFDPKQFIICSEGGVWLKMERRAVN